MAEQRDANTYMKKQLIAIEEPVISTIMEIVGGLSILGGIILCVTLWPRDPAAGYASRSAAYIAALTWLFSGFISGAIFFGFSSILSNVARTRIYSEAIAKKLYDLEDVPERRPLAFLEDDQNRTDQNEEPNIAGAKALSDDEAEDELRRWKQQMKDS